MPCVSCPNKIVWVRCYGIPLRGRDARVSGETLNKSSLEFGRVCVEVDFHKFLNEVLFINISGLKYKVSVREEFELQRSACEENFEKFSICSGRMGPMVANHPHKK